MRECCMLSSAILVILVAAIIQVCCPKLFYFFFFLPVPPAHSTETCTLLMPELPGSEDMTEIVPGIVLISAGDMESVLSSHLTIADHSPIAGLYTINLETKRISKAVIEGMPDIRFLPHGIFHSKKSGILYVVNHGMDKGGSSVLLFRMKLEGDIAQLSYIRNVVIPGVPMSGLNDVIEGGEPGEIYVSQWLTIAFPPGGAGAGTLLMDRNFLDSFFNPGTKLWRCTFPIDKSDTPATCNHAIDKNFRQANGLTTNPERTKVYMNDMAEPALYIFDRRKNGDLTLDRFVEVDFLGDNVEYNAQRNTLTIGYVNEPLNGMKKLKDSKVQVGSGCAEYDLETSEMKYSFQHDGSKFHIVSACLRSGDKLLLGSPFRSGVFYCDNME